MMLLLLMTPPILAAIYTINYGRWAWKRQYRRGAIGLYLLATASLVGPLLALWWNA